MRETYIPSSYLDTLLAQAEDANCDVSLILASVGLGRSDIKKLDEISARRYGEIYRLVMRETQDEWFGMFSGGGRVPLGSFRMMGLALLQCPNLRRAIYRASDFADICRGMNSHFFMETDDKTVSLTLSATRSVSKSVFEEALSHAHPDSVLTTILTWHRFTEWLIDTEVPLSCLSLRYSESEINAPLAYSDLRKVRFGANQNGLSYPSKYLDYPIVQTEESLSAFLRTAPYHLVTEDPSHMGPADKVRSILNRDVSGTMPTADQVASMLNVSVTTLRRQLQRESTSFQKIKDGCRLEAAYHYLGFAEFSNNDVADKLGFDEPSAFFRSFKKWTGMTPGEYRSSLN